MTDQLVSSLSDQALQARTVKLALLLFGWALLLLAAVAPLVWYLAAILGLVDAEYREVALLAGIALLGAFGYFGWPHFTRQIEELSRLTRETTRRLQEKKHDRGTDQEQGT
jgi:hypothetical protein